MKNVIGYMESMVISLNFVNNYIVQNKVKEIKFDGDRVIDDGDLIINGYIIITHPDGNEVEVDIDDDYDDPAWQGLIDHLRNLIDYSDETFEMTFSGTNKVYHLTDDK